MDPGAGRDQARGPTRRRQASWARRARGEQAMVPDARFSSYYGRPIVNAPVWGSPEIPGYLFLGGLAGASSLLGAGAQLTGRPSLERAAKAGAMVAGGLSMIALVRDLGRPWRLVQHAADVQGDLADECRFVAAKRVPAGRRCRGRLRPDRPAAEDRRDRHRRRGNDGTRGRGLHRSAVLRHGNTCLAYFYREMPFVFVGSAAMAAGGLGMLGAPGESDPARDFALAGVCVELTAARMMEQRVGLVAETYRTGRQRECLKASRGLAVLGAAGAVIGGRSALVRRLAGAASWRPPSRPALESPAWPRPLTPSTRSSPSGSGSKPLAVCPPAVRGI